VGFVAVIIQESVCFSVPQVGFEFPLVGYQDPTGVITGGISTSHWWEKTVAARGYFPA